MTVTYSESSPNGKLWYIMRSLQAADEAMANNETTECTRILIDQSEKLKRLAGSLLTSDQDTSKVQPADRELYWRRLREMKAFGNQRLDKLWSQLHAWVYEPSAAGGAIGSGFRSQKEAGKNDPITQAKWELGEILRLASIDLKSEFDRQV